MRGSTLLKFLAVAGAVLGWSTPAVALEGSGLRLVPGSSPAWPHDGPSRLDLAEPFILPAAASIRQRWSSAAVQLGGRVHRFDAYGSDRPTHAEGPHGAAAPGWHWRFTQETPVLRLGDGRRWDLLWRLGMGQHETGPSERYVTIGLAGTGLLSWRPHDRLDVRLYESRVGRGAYAGLPVGWSAASRWRDRGLAMSYDASISPSFQIGADLHWAPAALSLAPEGAIWFGLRAQVRF